MDYLTFKINEINSLINNIDHVNLNKLAKFLTEREEDTYSKHILPHYAARVMLFWGEAGVKELAHLIKLTPSPAYSGAILESLYYTSQKSFNTLRINELETSLAPLPLITDEMASLCHEYIIDIVNESLEERELFDRIISFIYMQNVQSNLKAEEPFSDFVFNIFRETSIKLSRRVIMDFENIIMKDLYEEEYQIYLKKHPAIIDPLAKEIIAKKKLGSDYITDFIIRKYDDEYILVEIEKPTTPIFTKSNDFTSQFTHALGQVLDFQEWIEANISYSQKQLPGIVSPKGLLILGLKKNLNEKQINKLKRFNINNKGRLKVITFDELVESSWRLYENMLKS